MTGFAVKMEILIEGVVSRMHICGGMYSDPRICVDAILEPSELESGGLFTNVSTSPRLTRLESQDLSTFNVQNSMAL